MNNKSLQDRFSKIIEIEEIVGEYKLVIEGLDKPLRVKVIKIRDNMFMGVANLEVKDKDAVGYYRSLGLKSTKEEAFEDAVTGFFMFYSKEAEIREVKNW